MRILISLLLMCAIKAASAQFIYVPIHVAVPENNSQEAHDQTNAQVVSKEIYSIGGYKLDINDKDLLQPGYYIEVIRYSDGSAESNAIGK